MNPRALKRGARAVYVFLAVAIPLLGGCLERELKPLNPCLVSGVVAEIAVTNVDKIDLLFMVDNSFSMEQEQQSLRTQFPRLINILTSGDKDGDGERDFPPAKDLHLGVVTSDLGLPGLEGARIEHCGLLGDKGELVRQPNEELAAMGMCSTTGTYVPPFLTYNAETADEAARMRLANDFSCLAAVGLDGCGFEQQLESTLKAVWPGADQMVTFVTDPTGFGMFGNAGPGFPNGEFIRNNPNEGPSLIALVLVTDEEDCSSRRMDHFVPGASANGLNTRCYYEGLRGAESNLFQVNRYIDLFKMLRPGQENLVIFAGIVGVPPRLTERTDGDDFIDGFDFNIEGQAEAYFDALLADPEMTERIDDKGTPDLLDDDGIVPSCNRGEDAKAYPPRRIVQVAKGFGANGVISSICTDDFTPAINAIIDVIAKQLGTVCLPRPLVRNSQGLVGCNVVWELPKTPVGGAPMRCEDKPEFLLQPDPGRPTVGEKGGAVCKVAQLAVADRQPDANNPDRKGPIPTQNGDFMATEGWYYDEFSEATQTECTGENKQRITFTPDAQPPTGVLVKLECLNETQSLANTRTDLENVQQPSIGSPCEEVTLRNQDVSGDDACIVLLNQPVDGSREDRRMFCHDDFKVCVLGCNTDADCPAAWVCDDRPDSVDNAGGRAYCTNPTCGGDQ